jgi:hypothetical protein
MGDILINIGIVVTYILIGIAIVLLVVFPLYYLVTNFNKAKGGLIGVAGIAVMFLLAYLVSPADQGAFYEKFQIGPSGSKMIGAGLLGVYICFGGILVSLLYFEAAKWFKN